MQEPYKQLSDSMSVANEILNLAKEKKWSPVAFEFALQMLMVTKNRII